MQSWATPDVKITTKGSPLLSGGNTSSDTLSEPSFLDKAKDYGRRGLDAAVTGTTGGIPNYMTAGLPIAGGLAAGGLGAMVGPQEPEITSKKDDKPNYSGSKGFTRKPRERFTKPDDWDSGKEEFRHFGPVERFAGFQGFAEGGSVSPLDTIKNAAQQAGINTGGAVPTASGSPLDLVKNAVGAVPSGGGFFSGAANVPERTYNQDILDTIEEVNAVPEEEPWQPYYQDPMTGRRASFDPNQNPLADARMEMLRSDFGAGEQGAYDLARMYAVPGEKYITSDDPGTASRMMAYRSRVQNPPFLRLPGIRDPHFAEGGPVQAQQVQDPSQLGMGKKEVAQQIVSDARAALMGQHPQPQVAVHNFIQAFGEDAFVKLRQQVAREMSGNRQQQGLGGSVQGQGTGTSDSIPAVINGDESQPAALSDGEFVMTKDAVDAAGGGDNARGAQVLQQQMAGLQQEAKAAPVEIMPRV